MGSSAFAQTADGASSASEGSVEGVVVTGSRIARQGFSSATPLTVVDADRMEKLGIVNAADAVNQLPSVRVTTTPATANGNPTTGGLNLIDLRALGPTRTLVLLNGRRIVPTTNNATVDVSIMPTPLIRRVDVVTGGASAAYGSDAVAGVVNFILDNRLQGFRGQLDYGQSFHDDARSYHGSLAGGTAFNDGRGHIVFALEGERQDGVGDCFSRNYCSNEIGAVNNPTPGVNGYPAIVIAHQVRQGTQTLGGVITGPAPLKGIQFADDGTPVPFNYGLLANGINMIGGTGQGIGVYDQQYLLTPVKRYNFYTHAEYDFTDNITGFVEANYAHTYSSLLSASGRDNGNLTIRQDNAYLPASIRQTMIANNIQTLSFGRLSEDLGFIAATADTTTYRFATGLNGKIGSNWTWDAYYQHGFNRRVAKTPNNRITANYNNAMDAVFAPAGNALGVPAGTIVCRSTLTNPSNGCVPLNLFGQYNWDPAAKRYVYATGFGLFHNTQDVAAANIQGKVFDAPAGPVSVAAGVEYRSDKAKTRYDPISASNGFFLGNGGNLGGTINVTEGYLETDIPVLKDVPLIKALDLNGAVRRTHYSTSGNVTTWKLSGTWDIVDWLRVRGTRSRDIRAPNSADLFAPPVQGYTNVTDSRGVSSLIPTIGGGNQNLRPEQGDTYTIGAVFQPSWGMLSGLRISADYYNIDIKDAIGAISGILLVQRCQNGTQPDFCSRLTLDSAGNITQIRNVSINLARFKESGVDIEAVYRLPLSDFNVSGDLTFRVLGNYVAHLITVDTGGSIDRAGQTGFPLSGTAGLPRWRVDSTITWANGPFALTGQVRFISAGRYDVTKIGPDQAGYSPYLANSISDNHVPSRTYFNLAAQYKLAGGVELFGNVNNLFDKNPPQFPGGMAFANQFLFDTIGRTFRVGVRYTR